MPRFNDLSGIKFHRLTAIERSKRPSKSRNVVWKCKCECGNISHVVGSKLKNGTTKSCGCLKRSRFYVHGMHKTKIYYRWRNMIQRCYNPKFKQYKDYGGRGINVCSEWRYGNGEKTGFECFYRDMGDFPEGKTLDRIDNDKGYYQQNCKWSTPREQQLNRRNCKKK